MSHVACRMSHVTCHMSDAYVDRLDMLNNCCFHVYAQMSLFMGVNVNGFFWTAAAATSSREFANHRAGSQLKIVIISYPRDKL